jgi:hypothetical protein
MINSSELNELMLRFIDVYFLDEAVKEWHPFSEVLITLLCQLATFHEYTNQTR